MAEIRVNSAGVSFVRSLVRKGMVDKESEWDFTAEDGNRLLGKNGSNWARFASVHLGRVSGANPETKEAWAFPVAKIADDGRIRVYRRGLIAAKARAAQTGRNEIAAVADRILRMVDKEDSARASLFSSIGVTKVHDRLSVFIGADKDE